MEKTRLTVSAAMMLFAAIEGIAAEVTTVAEVRERAARRVAEIRATTDRPVPAGVQAYYLSSKSGDDAADGRTPKTAWRTVTRLNREKLAPGSWVLFERGGLHREEVKGCRGVTYGAWGEGPKPRIYGSPEDGAVPAKWQRTEVENVWAYDIGHDDVGTLVFDGGAAHAIKIVFRTDAKTGKHYSMYTGRPFESYRDLDTDLHFWHDYYAKGTGKVYLYSRQNPGERFKSIEFNVKKCGFRLGATEDVTIENFDIRYVGIHGISAGNARNLHVANCCFEWIGGSIQAEGLFGRDYPTRLGNGIEVYGGCDNYTVENCAFDQVYDAGVTHQLNIPENVGMQRFDHQNVIYRDNVFRRCCYSIEYFLTALNGNPSRMEHILFERNLSLDCGFGFSEQRPDTGVAAHIKAWRKNEFRNRATDYVIRDNVFCGSKDMVLQICSSLRNPDGADSMPTMTGNVVFGGPSPHFGTISQTTAAVMPCGDEAKALLDSRGAGNVFIPDQAAARALLPPALGEARLDGRVGERLGRSLETRVYSDWAKGPMYDEAENAFRTHADDLRCGWQNEYWGKMMLCVAGAIAYTGDAGLREWALAKAHRFVADYQQPNGYLSTYSKEDFLGGATNGYGKWCFNIWGRKYTLWALIELHRATGDKACLDAAVKMADHLIAQLQRLNKPIWKTGSWNGISSMSILRPFNELYRLTGDKRYLAFSAEIVRGLSGAAVGPGALLANARSTGPIWSWFPGPAFWAKAYESMSCLEGAADYLKLSDDRSAREGLFAYMGHLEREEINPMRSAGHFDHFFGGGITFNGMTELCDVVHWIRLNREFLLLTGQAKYADQLEEAFYNAFLAGVSRDGRWSAHNIRSHGTRHWWAPSQTGMIEHQCCPDNMLRGYFDIAQTLAMEERDGTVDVILYADGETRLKAGTVRVRGGYPYADGPVVVNVNRKTPGKVRFRVPAWSAAKFAVNGKPANVVEGWHVVDGVTQGSFSLTFDRTPRIVDVPADNERRDNGKQYADNPAVYTQNFMMAMTPDSAGLARRDPAVYVMMGPLVLAKGRLAGTSREETLFATSIRGQGKRAAAEGWKASIERVTNNLSASAGVVDLWQLTLSRGAVKVVVPVSDFASVSNVDDPANWYSLWF